MKKIIVIIVILLLIFLDSKRIFMNKDSVVKGMFKIPYNGYVSDMKNADGKMITGSVVNGKITGIGKIVFPDGVIYQGEIQNNNANGLGILTDKDGSSLKGEFKDGKANGFVEISISNTDKYIGEYKNGKFEGEGVYYYNSGEFKGDVYKGTFSKGSKSGKGIYTATNNEWKYEGEFLNGTANGFGKILYKDGTIKEGIWKDGKLVKTH